MTTPRDLLPPYLRRAPSAPTRRSALGIVLGTPLLAGCGGGLGGMSTDFFSSAPPAPAQQPTAVGTGGVKAALILPLTGSASAVAQSMRNAAELALSEFPEPNVQLLIKDDAGSASGAQQAAQQAIEEGAEIILGPVFAQSVPQAANVARQRGLPVIAFSTDSSVAGRGVYLLSFLPESDVNRIVDYAVSTGKRSFAALVPQSAYGNVAEAAFTQAVARRGARIVALQRYADPSQLQGPAANIAQALPGADALFLPDDGSGAVPAAVAALTAAGANLRRVQLLGTGQWDNPSIYQTQALQGGLFAAPDPAGFRSFSTRYRTKYGQDPVRAATLSYDAVALVAALVKTQGPARFSQETLTNPSGFTGTEGLFRFRSDGTNERGLAVLRVGQGGPQVASPAPKSFGPPGT
jgi:ABC-type branched-subunit amino acid transport system substrate-binding protein